MTVEERLAEYLKGPGTFVTMPERAFIEFMRTAAAAGVGYGWMQQIIEWEWEAKVPGGSWGPEYFERRIDALERRIT